MTTWCFESICEPPLCELFACDPGVVLCCTKSRDTGVDKLVSSSLAVMWVPSGSRQALGGGWATSAIERGKPSSSAPISDVGAHGLKKPDGADGDGHTTPPPYALNALCVIILPVWTPRSGPTLKLKSVNWTILPEIVKHFAKNCRCRLCYFNFHKLLPAHTCTNIRVVHFVWIFLFFWHAAVNHKLFIWATQTPHKKSSLIRIFVVCQKNTVYIIKSTRKNVC